MSRGAKKEKSLTDVLGAFLEKQLLPDLRARAGAAGIQAALRHRWEHERAEERTAEAFEPWVDQTVEQVGAAWILSCVFVRTLEDRGLLPRRRLAGEGAEDSEHYFYEIAPSLNARDYLLTVFKEVSRFPGVEELLGPKGNSAWRLGPSAPVAQALLAELRERTAEGKLRWDFSGADTRFLGDLYQDLSASVRARYALLQTPEFVERFILKLTLDPAIQEFGLEEVRVMDPTCGSGHFLLGAYDKLFDARMAAKPGVDRRQHALDALAQVYGVDINPYAVAIARFRLTLSYLEKAGIEKLAQAPRLPLNLVVADSLLYGSRGVNMELSERATSKKEWGDALFTLEEPERAMEVLSHGYRVVVGNPPYITCKDAKLREKYRSLYASAAGKYALGVPFTERFFQLAAPSGFVGLINANSFMKHLFGKKLIEAVLPKLELTHVIDTSGAFIPGPGTPTVILVGRSREPTTERVRAVLGKRGEPETPAEPEKGKVWSSIAEHLGEVGFENEYVSVADVERETFKKYPWSLAGGGAAELKKLIESRCEKPLGQLVEDIGFASFTGLDDVFITPAAAARSNQLEPEIVRPMVVGESVRDWSCDPSDVVIAPYDKQDHRPLPLQSRSRWGRFLWQYRSTAESVSSFGGKTRKEEGQNWWQWYRWQANRYRAPFRIAFAEVATHNHFVLDRGGKAFKQTAPIIKLPEGATEGDHLALLGYLNSSTACFWMKQQCHVLTNHTEDRPEKFEPGTIYYQFNSSTLKGMPVPKRALWPQLARFARAFEALANEEASWSPDRTAQRLLVEEASPGEVIRQAGEANQRIYRRRVALQEDLDWYVYGGLGLAEVKESGSIFELSGGLSPEQRPFACPGPWPELDGDQVKALARRRAAIGRSRELAFFENGEVKRRWIGAGRGSFGLKARDFQEKCSDAVLSLILEKCEKALLNQGGIISIREVIAALRLESARASELLRWFAGQEDEHEYVVDQVKTEAAPYLAVFRFVEDGVRKRCAWEFTWSLQRRQDAGEKLDEPIPAPPKYDQKDYRDPVYWRLRGKLDVPKERFISYPGAERDDDKSPLIGWAGWDHLQRAQALAALYQERKNQDGWEKERLMPLLAGLLELVPWLKQWHNEPSEDPAKDKAGDAYAAFVETEALGFGWTLADLRAWRPEEKRRGKIRRTARPSTPGPRRGPYAQGERVGDEAGQEDGTLALRQAQGERTRKRARGVAGGNGEAVIKTECPGEGPAPKPRKPRRKKAKSEETAE